MDHYKLIRVNVLKDPQTFGTEPLFRASTRKSLSRMKKRTSDSWFKLLTAVNSPGKLHPERLSVGVNIFERCYIYMKIVRVMYCILGARVLWLETSSHESSHDFLLLLACSKDGIDLIF